MVLAWMPTMPELKASMRRLMERLMEMRHLPRTRSFGPIHRQMVMVQCQLSMRPLLEEATTVVARVTVATRLMAVVLGLQHPEEAAVPEDSSHIHIHTMGRDHPALLAISLAHALPLVAPNSSNNTTLPLRIVALRGRLMTPQIAMGEERDGSGGALRPQEEPTRTTIHPKPIFFVGRRRPRAKLLLADPLVL